MGQAAVDGSTPRLLAELKKAVDDHARQDADIRLLRFAELSAAFGAGAAGGDFGESDVRTAVTLLANHGLARPLKFGDLILLRPRPPQWLCRGDHPCRPGPPDEIGCVMEAAVYDPRLRLHRRRAAQAPAGRGTAAAGNRANVSGQLAVHCRETRPTAGTWCFPSQYRRE